MKNKKIYTRLLLGAGCILITFMISGCQVRENNHSITFIEDEIIEYSSDFKISDLIESIDSYKREDFKIAEDDSLITLPDGKTVAVNVTDKKIKLDTIKFDFRYMNKTFTKEILIQDTTAPQIVCEDIYEVELGNEYFVLENLITSNDNFTSKPEIEIYFNGFYDVNKAGDYDIQVIAYDQKKNKAEKAIKITVKEEKIIVVEKPSTNNNENFVSKPDSSDNSNNTNKDNISNSNNNAAQNSNTESSSKPNSNYTPESRSFMIDDYNSFDECLAACQKYINECMDKGYKGRATAEPIKEDGVYIGYKAIFY